MRNQLIKSALTSGLFLTLPAAAGCSTRSGISISQGAVVDYAAYGPPPPQVDMVIRRPGPSYVWVDGYYDYYRGWYVWRPGYWGRPPLPGQRFYPPHYVPHHGGGYMVIQGGWR